MSKLRSVCWSLLGQIGLVSFLAMSLSPAALGAPVVRITEPQSGQMVSGQTWIQVTYRSDGDDPVEVIQLYVDKKLARFWRFPVPETEGQHSFLWNFVFTAGTAHAITAKAIDTKGNEGAAEIIVRMRGMTTEQPDQIPPVVNIYYPAQGAEVSGSVEIKANATDNVGVTTVFFYVDGKMQTWIYGGPPYVARWDTAQIIEGKSRYPDGLHVLKVSALDKAENRGDSAEVTVVVSNRALTTAEAPARTVAQPPEGVPEAPVVTPPIADAPASRPTPPEQIAEQTFGAPAIAERSEASATDRGDDLQVAALPTSTHGPGHTRVTRPAQRVLAPAPAPAAGLARLTPTRTVPKPTLVRVFSATTTKAIAVAGTPAITAESVAGRSAAVVPPVTTQPGELVSRMTPPAHSSAAWAAASPPQPVPAPMPVASLSSPQTRGALEYQVAMLPKSQPAGWPYAERLGKPETDVFLPTEIGKLRDIKVVFNGELLDLRAAPELKAGISVGPLREIFEQTDGVLYWFHVEKRVRAVNNDVDVNLNIGNPVVTVNDQQQELILAPYIKRGRTMVPLQFLADTLDVAIRYNPATGQLVVSSN